MPWWTSPKDSPAARLSSSQRACTLGCQKTTVKLCCCSNSHWCSPAGTESAAYPRGAPRRSRKSHWQSYGSYHSLCSTGHCHGALPTPGHTSCKDNTNQSRAEPPPSTLPEGANSVRAEFPNAAQGQCRSLPWAPDASRAGSPGAGPYVPVADVGVIPTRKEKGGRFVEHIQDSSSTVEVGP